MGGFFTKTLHCTLSQKLAKVQLEKNSVHIIKKLTLPTLLYIEIRTFFNDKFSKEWLVDMKQINGRKIT
jgi:hypothetical protein